MQYQEHFIREFMKTHSILLLQEPGDLHAHFSEASHGHALFMCSDHDRCPAIVVHRAWSGRVIFSHTSHHAAAVVLHTDTGNIAFISAYLPDAWKPGPVFYHALEQWLKPFWL
jgi:hypothetical protein